MQCAVHCICMHASSTSYTSPYSTVLLHRRTPRKHAHGIFLNVDSTRRVYVGYPRGELARRGLTSGNLSALRTAGSQTRYYHELHVCTSAQNALHCTAVLLFVSVVSLALNNVGVDSALTRTATAGLDSYLLGRRHILTSGEAAEVGRMPKFGAKFELVYPFSVCHFLHALVLIIPPVRCAVKTLI